MEEKKPAAYMTSLTQKSLRFYELDILRFLAAFAVVFFHYTFLNATEIMTLETFPVLGEIFKYGYLGVELFFMISGFVILLTASKKDWLSFIISRMVRLYPVFWIAVTLTSLAIVLFGNETTQVTFPQYLWNLTMLSDYFGIENIDPVYWTLQIELKFYFWIFIILIFRKIQYIDYFIFIWLVFSVLETFHLIHNFTHPILMSEWAPYFSAGALFYRIHTQGLTHKRFAMLILAYCLSVYFAIQGAELKTQLYGIYFSSVVIATLITIYYVIFTLIILGKTTHLCRSWFTVIGAITYPLYLLHQKLGLIGYEIIGQSINKYLLLILMTLSMITLAFLLHRFFEIGFAKGMKRKLESWLVLRI